MNEKKKRKVWKIILKSLLWFFGSIFALILLAWLFVLIFSDKIEQKVISRINQDLNTEIQVEDIRVSLFYDFPNVSVVFEDIVALDATENKEGHLFRAHEAALEFNLLSIIFGDYTIRKIYLSDGVFQLKRFADGSDNYHFLKTDTTNAEQEAATYDLRHIEVKNMGFLYVDFETDQKYKFFIHRLKASGQFSNQVFEMDVKGDFRTDTLYTDGMYFVPGREAELKATLEVNTEQESVSFSDASLWIEEVRFYTKGKIEYADSSNQLDITVESEKLKMGEMIALLPENYQGYFSDFKQQGTMSFTCRVFGKYAKNNALAVDVKLALNGGSLENYETNLSLDNISFQGSFSTLDIRKASLYELKINNFSANLEEHNIKGRFMMKNFKSPETKFLLKGSLSLEKVQEWADVPFIKSMQGLLSFDIAFEGHINSSENINFQDFLNSKTAGNLSIENGMIDWLQANYPLKNIEAEAEFSNTDLEILYFSANYGKSDFSAKGYFKDFVPYIFLPDQKLQIGGELTCKRLDLFDLFAENPSQSLDDKVQVSLPDNILANITLTAKLLEYNKFGASDLKAAVKIKDKKLFVERVSMKTFGGKLKASGIVDASNNKDIYVSCEADFIDMDIREALISFDQFGQSSLTSDNIRGKTNTHLQFSAMFSKDLAVNNKSIVAVADIEVFNGELVGYEPLTGLKSILKNRDFSHIEFDKLKNTISISNEKITIPKMEIKSSAMNLKLSGEHNFENEIEYHLEIKFADLKNNNSQENPESEYGYIEDDGVGNPTVFILITGTVDDPQYKQLDKKALKEKITQDIQEEKQNLKKILNEEFGFFKKDTSLQKIEEPLKQETIFIIEWDEE